MSTEMNRRFRSRSTFQIRRNSRPQIALGAALLAIVSIPLAILIFPTAEPSKDRTHHAIAPRPASDLGRELEAALLDEVELGWPQGASIGAPTVKSEDPCAKRFLSLFGYRDKTTAVAERGFAYFKSTKDPKARGEIPHARLELHADVDVLQQALAVKESQKAADSGVKRVTEFATQCPGFAARTRTTRESYAIEPLRLNLGDAAAGVIVRLSNKGTEEPVNMAWHIVAVQHERILSIIIRITDQRTSARGTLIVAKFAADKVERFL